jgi:N-hydroxyarylamine O-acetyltransferase
MDVAQYLRRINYADKICPDDHTLTQLHEQHVRHVPFENLDVYYKRFFDLQLPNIYNKVVVNYRGGFCYELNAIFNELLCQLGFKSYLIAARIFDDFGNLGPAYDHLCLYVEAGKSYLAAVGFGDLFIKPLEIKAGIQPDGKNLFKIEQVDYQNFRLLMGLDQANLRQKYAFSLSEVLIDQFSEICIDKQTNPTSYFVKNLVCTKPTQAGRLTIFNHKLIEKRATERTETLIRNDQELREILKTLFGLVVA